jgi:hypothetical protein
MEVAVTDEDEQSALSPDTIMGIGVGIGVCLVICCLLLLLFLVLALRRRKAKDEQENSQTSSASRSGEYAPVAANPESVARSSEYASISGSLMDSKRGDGTSMPVHPNYSYGSIESIVYNRANPNQVVYDRTLGDDFQEPQTVSDL